MTKPLLPRLLPRRPKPQHLKTPAAVTDALLSFQNRSRALPFDCHRHDKHYGRCERQEDTGSQEIAGTPHQNPERLYSCPQPLLVRKPTRSILSNQFNINLD
jgi:hypothetical protein